MPGKNAFTLYETLVVLAITGILVSIVYGVYLMFSSIWRQENSDYSFVTSSSQFVERLQSDLDRALTVKGNENQLELINESLILYENFGDFIVRFDENRMDTFKFDQIVLGINYRKDFPQLVDSIHLSLFEKGENLLQTTLIKNYSPQVLVNQQMMESEHIGANLEDR